MFDFVRFKSVQDEEDLYEKLDQIHIGYCELNVNLPRFNFDEEQNTSII